MLDDNDLMKLDLDFSQLQFKCRFKGCQATLTYDEMISEVDHADCEFRPYECQKCKVKVIKSRRNYHRLNECKSEL